MNERYSGEDGAMELVYADYVAEVNDILALNAVYIDARDSTEPARYMNHGHSKSSATNVKKFRQRWPARKFRFFAARDISPGEELLWDYGGKYWLGRQGQVVEK